MRLKIGGDSPIRNFQVLDKNFNSLNHHFDTMYIDLILQEVFLPEELHDQIKPFCGDLTEIAIDKIYMFSCLNAIQRAQV